LGSDAHRIGDIPQGQIGPAEQAVRHYRVLRCGKEPPGLVHFHT
jgi:hypothetical protein